MFMLFIKVHKMRYLFIFTVCILVGIFLITFVDTYDALFSTEDYHFNAEGPGNGYLLWLYQDRAHYLGVNLLNIVVCAFGLICSIMLKSLGIRIVINGTVIMLTIVEIMLRII